MPLTDSQKDIIKATVPILEAGGEVLTTHFYKLMFAEFPEVRPLFNQANQRSGDQPRALANSVLMYAKHIDELHKLGPLVAQIVNKHVALQVLPAQYPIVGSCLLRAMTEVLGKDTATPEVLDAWGVAYQQLADLLIDAEESVYAANEKAPGGWRGARKFKVAKRVHEADRIDSFYLEPVDGKDVVAYKAGQYLGLQIFIDGEEMRRNYSLSEASNGKSFRITVQREDKGRVSSFLHDKVNVGDVINVFPPAGEFVLEESKRPVVFLCGGVGVTPALAMTQELLHTQRPITFVHCVRSQDAHAFRAYLSKLDEQHPNFKHCFVYSDPKEGETHHHKGYITKELLEEWLPKDKHEVDVYFLGPKPFMAVVKGLLQDMDVPAQQCHYEFFGPAASLEVPKKEAKTCPFAG